MITPEPEQASFNDVLRRIRTGDVFVFHGTSRLSRRVERATLSHYSHAAMVIRPDLDGPPLLWHTGPRPVNEDVSTHSRHGGAQLNDLRDTLALMATPRFGDTPFWRALEVERTPEFESAALQLVADLDGTPFGTMAKMAENWAIGQIHIPASDRTFFCAELVAHSYMKLGLLPAHPPQNAYSPHSFSDEHGTLPLRFGASLASGVQILAPNSVSSGA
jgi:hypothetical protein